MTVRFVLVLACLAMVGLALRSTLVSGADSNLTISGDVVLGGAPNFDIEGVGYKESRCVGGPEGSYKEYFAGADVVLVDDRGDAVGGGHLEAGYLGDGDNDNFAVCVMTFAAFDVEPADDYGVVVDGVELGRFRWDDLSAVGWFVVVEAAG